MYYTASSIITLIGGRPVHGTATYRRDDTRGCISLFHASTCFEHHVLIVRRSKLYYTASGIITLIGGRPVHLCTGRSPTEYDDTRGCIIQF